MASRRGRCINFGRCPQADSGETVVVRGGEEFICPSLSCGDPLEPVSSSERGSRLRTYLLAGTIAALILVGGLMGYLWYSPTKAAATEVGNTPAVAAPAAAATLRPTVASDRPAVANDVDVCHQTDWTKAQSKDFVTINCVGKGVPAYDKRLEYVYSLNQVENWSNIKRGDPRLQDCAGLRECEERAQNADTPRPLPQPVILADKPASRAKTDKWATASCESITQTWESEDPRLSTATCDGLGLLECSHIKRCLGLHDINLGPGSSKIEP